MASFSTASRDDVGNVDARATTPATKPSPDDQTACDLPVALAIYADALALCDGQGAELVGRLVATLKARDQLAEAVTRQQGLEVGSVQSIAKLDAGLRRLAIRVEHIIGLPGMRVAAVAVAPTHDAGWWWDVDVLLPRPQLRWDMVAGVLLAGAIALVAEIIRRLFAEGPDLVGAAYIVVQAGVALVAGGALLERSNGLFQSWLDAHGVRRFWHPWCRVALAALTLLLAIVGFRLLPSVAQSYTNTGTARYSEGRINAAIRDYRRALSLHPDFAEVHYALGRAYEKVIDYERAIGAYQRALELQPDMYLAANGLARLYLMHKDNPTAALALIDSALTQAASTSTQPAADVARATLALFKNRGWANLKAGHLRQARLDLLEGLYIDADRASLHCLLAQLDETEGEADSPEWHLCLSGSVQDDVESTWRAMAQDRLDKLGVVK